MATVGVVERQQSLLKLVQNAVAPKTRDTDFTLEQILWYSFAHFSDHISDAAHYLHHTCTYSCAFRSYHHASYACICRHLA